MSTALALRHHDHLLPRLLLLLLPAHLIPLVVYYFYLLFLSPLYTDGLVQHTY